MIKELGQIISQFKSLSIYASKTMRYQSLVYVLWRVNNVVHRVIRLNT